jgi:hypothetical protein
MTALTTVSWRIRASSLVVLLLAVAVASCGSTAPGSVQRPRVPRPAPRVLDRLAPVQRDNFALLRTRPEGLPARTRRLVIGRTAGIDPKLAHRIPVVVPGSYWLVPGIGQLCIVSEVPGIPGVGTICARTRQVVHEGLATISFTPRESGGGGVPTRLVVGVAPDDAREALVHTHGSVAVVPVFRGVFVLRDSMRAPSDFIELRRTRAA